MIVSFYAPLFALLFVVLSFRTLLLRRKHKIAIGTGSNEQLARAIAVHANFSQYVPLALILVFLLENNGSGPLSIHILCVVLLIGRIVHAIGVSRSPENLNFRVFGMVCTFTVLISTSLRLLWQALV